MISRRSRSPLVRNLRSASLNHPDRLREGRDKCVGRGYSKYVKRAWKMTDMDILKLVNAVQGTELDVAWHEINSHRLDESSHTRPDREWMVNYRPRSQARRRPDTPIDE
jgi:hypothetical protein